MKNICTAEASHLLGICRQRLNQLLCAGRIQSAFKAGGFWRIPLYNGMPKVIPGTRGPKGKWRQRTRTALTVIHVNSEIIRANHHREIKEPVICVRQGERVDYCHKVDLSGNFGKVCRLVYDPENQKSYGATVWFEVDPSLIVETQVFHQTLASDSSLVSESLS